MDIHPEYSSGENLAARQCHLVRISESHLRSASEVFRAVRNLHQLVLRQQKIEKEEEESENEDPIKRVRQQLEKVTSSICRDDFFQPALLFFRSICSFMTSRLLPMK